MTVVLTIVWIFLIFAFVLSVVRLNMAIDEIEKLKEKQGEEKKDKII